MAETVFKCNICRDGKIYTSIEANKHKIKTGHDSFWMLKRQNGIRDTKEHN